MRLLRTIAILSVLASEGFSQHPGGSLLVVQSDNHTLYSRDVFLERATKARWSPRMLLEQLAQTEAAERSRRSLERRLRLSGLKSFKPMADFDWSWPTKIERDSLSVQSRICTGPGASVPAS